MFGALGEIERRVLWLATAIVPEANLVRPSLDGLKVGGQRTSSASMVSIMTSLWFRHLRPQHRVSVKPRLPGAARRLRAGRVMVNNIIDAPDAPFGGFRQSGIWREFGVYGLEAYLEDQVVFSNQVSHSCPAHRSEVAALHHCPHGAHP